MLDYTHAGATHVHWLDTMVVMDEQPHQLSTNACMDFAWLKQTRVWTKRLKNAQALVSWRCLNLHICCAVYKVTVSRHPSCTCPDFQKGNFCKHLLFVMLRVIRLADTDPLVWQRALLTSEVSHGVAYCASCRIFVQCARFCGMHPRVPEHVFWRRHSCSRLWPHCNPIHLECSGRNGSFVFTFMASIFPSM